MNSPSPKCPLCGAPAILKDGQHVCSEFDAYKDELANRKLEAADFMEPPRRSAPIDKTKSS